MAQKKDNRTTTQSDVSDFPPPRISKKDIGNGEWPC